MPPANEDSVWHRAQAAQRLQDHERRISELERRNWYLMTGVISTLGTILMQYVLPLLKMVGK